MIKVEMHRRKVILFSYFYPPCGGPGVQRPMGFCTHLPEFGYIPIVVTALEQGEKGRPYDPMNPTDGSLPVPAGKIIRIGQEQDSWIVRWTRHRWPNRLFPWMCGEAHIWATWLRQVMQRIPEILEHYRPDVAMITVPPYLCWKLAKEIKRHSQVPVVMDYRDPWALDEFAEYSTWFDYRVTLQQHRRSLRLADHIILVTPAAKMAFEKTFRIPEDRLTCITNGFSESDFQKTMSNPMKGTINIVRTGGIAILASRGGCKRLFGFSPYKGGVERQGRSPLYFLEALEKVCEQQPSLRECLRVYLVGVVSKYGRQAIAKSNVSDLIEVTGYLPHSECLRYTRNASILVLNMQSVPGGHRLLTVRGQTYEYMASGKPVLACVPEGDVADFIRAAGTGFVCHPTDVKQIAHTLSNLIGQHQNGGIKTNWNRCFVAQFERKHLTKRLATVFDTAINRGCSREI